MHNIVLDADRLVVPASVLVRLDSCVAPFEMNLPEVWCFSLFALCIVGIVPMKPCHESE